MVRLALDLTVEVFHHHRDTGEGASPTRLRLCARSLKARVNDGIDLRVDAFDCGNREVDEFAWRNLLCADEFCLRSGIEVQRVAHVPTH
jgi:hypothetical protein